MIPQPESPSEATTSAVERAIAFGVDITLLVENLRLTPTDRVQRLQQMLNSVVAFQAEVKAWRQKQARQDK
mgnify:CR=1 FL=1